MTKFKLQPYRLRIRDNSKSDKNKYIDLQNLKIDQKPFLDFVTGFCESYFKKTFKKEDEQKTLSVFTYKFANSKKLIYGLVKSGTFGMTADLLDINTNKRKKEVRKQQHSEEMPYMFLLYLPDKNADRAYVILQTISNYGVKTIFQSAFNKQLNSKNKELFANINPIIDEKLLDDFFKSSKLVKLKLIRHKVPRDVTDRCYIKNNQDIIQELSYTAKRNKNIEFSFADQYNSVIKNLKKGYAEIYGEDFDEIKLIFKNESKNNQQTVKLSDNCAFREQLLLSPKEDEIEKGHPKLNYLFEESKIYLNRILEKDGYNKIK